MRLFSDALRDGEPIPLAYTKDGDNISPPLAWDDLPAGTRELALIFENITPSTKEPFAQWLLYGIPPDRAGVPEGLKHKHDPEDPAEARHGANDLGNVGYDGPQGSVGRTWRYRLRLLALDRRDAGPGLDRAGLLDAASGHVLDEASMVVTYERPR